MQFLFTFHLIVPLVWYNLICFGYFILVGFIVCDVNIIKSPKNKIDIINYDSVCDFGKVKYILSDKTGTLSSRRFILKSCMVSNKFYSFDPLDKRDENFIYRVKDLNHKELEIYQDLKGSERSEAISEFFEYLLLCHNVNVKVKTIITKEVRLGGEDGEIYDEKKIQEKKFNSSVAEEKAMLKTLKNFGYNVDKVTSKEMILKIHEEFRTYYLLGQNRYTDDRKRMSVLIKKHKGDKESILLCKGTDHEKILDKLSSKYTEEYIQVVRDQILNMVNIGLRYFIFCKRKLSEKQTNEFLSKYKLAENYVLQKEVLFDNVFIIT